MRILFIGSTKRGLLSLEALVNLGAEVVGVISLKQDKHEIENYESNIKELCQKRSIPLYESKLVSEEKYKKLIEEELRPDLCFIVGARVLIPKEIYQIPPKGSLAIHDSLLPKYRGFAPLNWSIINGEEKTGATLFYLTEKADEGDYIGQKEIPIGPNETANEVYQKICQISVEIIEEYYPLLKLGKAPRIQQNHDQATYTCARSPIDGIIDWNLSSKQIHDFVRALSTPYPGAYSFYKGEPIKIWKTELISAPAYVGHIAGKVIELNRDEGYCDVLTGDGAIRILEIGTKEEQTMKAAELIKSVRECLGQQDYTNLMNKLF